ncbi:hypothetical protein ACIPRU_32125 [Streptomyces sp. NPDC090126]|uniref:hypothetical protein n=1 Tax=Streptomyces sp. NPDC090126 TaxID=3365952 RepID=UPI0037F3BCFF
MAQRPTTEPRQPSRLQRAIAFLIRAHRTLCEVTAATDHAAKLLQKAQAAWRNWVQSTERQGAPRWT